MKTTPAWQTDVQAPLFPTLAADIEVDVLVVGGGITGVTAAFLLKRAGRTVALIERGTIGGGETGHTTAHVTHVTDTRLSELVKTFGRDHALAAWDAGNFAMEEIASLVAAEGIECEMRRVPGYLVAAPDGDLGGQIEALENEAALARELGFDAAYLDAAPLFPRPAICFANQLKFHPLKYLFALAQRIPRDGSFVFEQTAAAEFCDEPGVVIANGRRIRFTRAILATHVPIQGHNNALSAALLQTKLAAYSTYAVGARLTGTPAPEAVFWDTANPYLYLRVDRRADGDYVILGGADHKTGQEEDTAARFVGVESSLLDIWPDAAIDHHWSGQVIETVDGLPFIGETAERQFVATGFGGNGMTFGTLAATMACDWVCGRRNPWADLFGVERKKLSAAWDYLAENKDYPYYLVRNRLAATVGDGVASVGCREGKILSLAGSKVAVYRDEHGAVTTLSPVCPHLGCIVAWNGAENTWDCPCHGSRFAATGAVIAGPAEQPLADENVPSPLAYPIRVETDASTARLDAIPS